MDIEKNNPSSIEEQPLVNSLDDSKKSIFTSQLLIVLAVAVLLGVGSGYLLTNRENSVGIPGQNNGKVSSSASKGTIIGSNDTKTFKDTVEGVMKVGGIDGEGAYHLVRPGGDSQNVYLTSSSVDLSQVVDKKVKVWGETQKAMHAGWLMDVGRVQIL